MAKFRKGKSGNPNGRPKGIVDRRSQYVALIEQHMPAIVGQVVSAAIGGDMAACKILIDKVLPSVRSTAPVISLAQSGESVSAQSGVVIEAMLNGSLAPDQAATAISVLIDHARLCEHTELESRLHILERKNNATAI